MCPECNFSECNAVLMLSKVNTLIVEHSSNIKRNLLQWIEKNSYENFIRQKANGLDLSAVIPVDGVPIPINLGYDMSEAKYNELQGLIREGKISTFSQEEADKIIQKNVDPIIYDHWLKCMNGMMKLCSSSGIHHQVAETKEELIITIWYVPINEHDPYPKVENFFISAGAGECLSGCLKKGKKISNEHVIIIKKNVSKEGTVMIDTDKGSIIVPLKAKPVISEEVKQKSIPQIENYIKEKLEIQKIPLGEKGYVKVEELTARETIVNFKIKLHFEFKIPSIVINLPPPLHDIETQEILVNEDYYFQDWLNIDNSNSFENREVCPNIQFSEKITSEKKFCIPLKDIATIILSNT